MRTHLVVAAAAGAALALVPSASAAVPDRWTSYPSGTSDELTGVDYVNASTIIAVTSSGKILKNGAVKNDTAGATSFTDVRFGPSGTTGLAVGSAAKIYRSSDAGETWNPVAAGTTYNHSCPDSGSHAAAPVTTTITDVTWGNDATAYALTAGRGSVLKSTDAGATWSEVSKKPDGSCVADPGSIHELRDIQASPASNIVHLVTDGFGRRIVSNDGFASASVVEHNSTAVNCTSGDTDIAIDPSSPNKSWVAGCAGGLGLGFSSDSAANYEFGLDYKAGQKSSLRRHNDVSAAQGSALAVGLAGQVILQGGGDDAYFVSPAGATSDWNAVDKLDANTAVIGGQGGEMRVTTRAAELPDLVAPAGTIAGPTTVTAGQPATYTANLADNAGGSGVDPASLAWNAPGIPTAGGNPVAITFPNAGVKRLEVSFTDQAGNAANATLNVNVRPGIAPGTRNPHPTTTTIVPGGRITLRGPRSCVRVGKTFGATLSFKRSRKKGAKKIKITRVDFFIDGKRVKIDRKAPFSQRLSVKSYLPSSRHTLKARAYIKVKRGKSPKKSITTSLQVCSA